MSLFIIFSVEYGEFIMSCEMGDRKQIRQIIHDHFYDSLSAIAINELRAHLFIIDAQSLSITWNYCISR